MTTVLDEITEAAVHAAELEGIKQLEGSDAFVALQLVAQYNRQKRIIDEAKTLQDKTRAALIRLMGDAKEIRVGDQSLAKHVGVTTFPFDKKGFAKGHPDLYASYIGGPSISDRLIVS